MALRDTAYYAVQIARAAHETHGMPLLLAHDQPMQPLPFEDVKAIIHACFEATGDRELGVRAGAAGQPLGASGLALAPRPRVEHAFTACTALLQRTTDVLRHTCTLDREHVTLQTQFNDDDPVYQRLVGDLLVSVAIANLRHAGIEDAVLHREGPAGLVLRRDALQVPHRIDADVSQFMTELRVQSSLGYDIGARIAASLGTQARIPTVDELAADLGLPPRTLQNRLKYEGTSVRMILARLRRELFMQWLSHGLTREEIAWRLGFSEPASLRRARRRWAAH